MSATAEAMEQAGFHLAMAGDHAGRLGRMLLLGVDELGRPAVFCLYAARARLANALRQAADCCETLGVEQNDPRWVGTVALLHNASTLVWKIAEPGTCWEIARLMRHMRDIIVTLRDRSIHREVVVRLSS